jgi:hypothetical protein
MSDADLGWESINESEAGQFKGPGKTPPSPQECVG